MANGKHLDILLKQGVRAWNEWRESNDEVPDFNAADLSGIDLRYVNLIGADLCKAEIEFANLSGARLELAKLQEINLKGTKLHGANLMQADLSNAVLRITDFKEAFLWGTKLCEADLYGANLSWANVGNADLSRASLIDATLVGTMLHETNLTNADLRSANLRGAILRETVLVNAKINGADLSEAHLVRTNLVNANLAGCRVYGISVWDLNLEATDQSDLIITRHNEPVVTVDRLEVAQFIYLLLHNENIRNVIDTITSKAVLILGRFTPERKAVLDALRNELRKRNYTPILFDFEKPTSRDLTETVMILAGLSRFVIADLSDPNSIPHELMSFVEKLLSVPVQAIFCPVPEHKKPYPMYEHLRRYPHVLPIYEYESQEKLIDVLYRKVILPAEEKVKEMQSGG